MRLLKKSLVRSILFSVLILSSCTTLEVKTFDPIRLSSEEFPSKVPFVDGDNETLTVSKYEMKNAVYYYEFLKAYMEKERKDSVTINTNTKLLEEYVNYCTLTAPKIEKERNIAYAVVGTLITGILVGIALK